MRRGQRTNALRFSRGVGVGLVLRRGLLVAGDAGDGVVGVGEDEGEQEVEGAKVRGRGEWGFSYTIFLRYADEMDTVKKDTVT